jgi:hypothetical protein
MEIVLSKELIEKLLPTLEVQAGDKDGKSYKQNLLKGIKNQDYQKYTDKNFPKDDQILKIAKKIMNGKIK